CVLATVQVSVAAGLRASALPTLPWVLSGASCVCGLTFVAGWAPSPCVVLLRPPGNRLRYQVEHDLAPFWRDRRLLVWTSALSLVFHLSQVVVQWLLARAAGTSLPFSYFLVMHPILSLMMALPLSIAGFGFP